MSFKHAFLALALAAGFGLTLSGCGSDDATTVAEGANVPAEAAEAAAPTPTAVPPPPQLNARSFIVIDHDSGRVLAAREPDSRQEPASLTKLMTAYAVFKALEEGRLKLADLVTISEHAWKQEGSRMFVEVGKQVSVNDLLQGMIVQSGNDATVALAEKVGGTEDTFVQMMNTYAKQLGMTGSHFTNSAGMPDPEHYMTARDSATLASALIHEFPDYYKLYAQREFAWNGITQQNRNGLLWRDPTVDGVKTGHTETAGYCLIASARRDGMRLVSVVLGTDSMRAREDASAALLNYGFNFFETKRIYAAGQPLTTVRVWKGRDDEVGLALRRDLYVTSQRGQVSSVKADFELPETIEAPLAANKAVGKTQIVVDGAPVAAYDLYPAKDVARAGFFGRTWDGVRLMFH
ncbi:MAG TPA: D-alanyl-D-alanine carboxypeptidase family protein [Steroidobacteraceae bacterium]|nr:D-alanyl-D-alanine carboxypeptidase family protein [Steroidobacteraceae bacterium]